MDNAIFLKEEKSELPSLVVDFCILVTRKFSFLNNHILFFLLVEEKGKEIEKVA